MGFWPPAVLIGDAKRHGVAILPLDIHRSHARCTLEQGGIRLGVSSVNGLGATATEHILARRPFVDLADLCKRTKLACSLVERLIAAGALDSWGIARRQLLWQLGTLRYAEAELDLPIPHTVP